MPEIKEYVRRPESEFAPERKYLESRAAEIERGLGTVAAKLGSPTPAAPRLMALDRAREIVSELHGLVPLRPLEDAVAARLAWLERAQARQADPGSEPRTDLDMIALDRRLLEELLAGWRSRRQ